MTCPQCGAETSVEYTLTAADRVCRKRKCKDCSYIMYTTEISTERSHFDYNTLEAIKREKRRHKSDNNHKGQGHR